MAGAAHQRGSNYARTLATSAPTGLIATGTAYAELNSRARIRAFLDLFNLTNSHASETISRATGLGYQKPSAILAPMTARIGARFLW